MDFAALSSFSIKRSAAFSRSDRREMYAERPCNTSAPLLINMTLAQIENSSSTHKFELNATSINSMRKANVSCPTSKISAAMSRLLVAEGS